MVIWIIGLSGAGKTTVGEIVTERLRGARDNVVFLDGDVIRRIFGDDVGHSIDGRRKNAGRIVELCKFLEEQGQIVVVAILSIFPEMQRNNRQLFDSYFQVYLQADIDELERRDTKGLYTAAKNGEIDSVVGVQISFPEPVGSDLIFNTTDESKTAEEIAGDIIARTGL